MIQLPRFRRFGTRLLVFIVLLLFVPQTVTYLLVSRANRSNALSSIDAALARGALQFQSDAKRRQTDLLLSARVLAADYALRQLFLIDEFSPATARSALASFQKRIGAPVLVMLDDAGHYLVGLRENLPELDPTPWVALQRIADFSEEFEAAGWDFIDGTLHQIVIVPLYAPPPHIVAWIGLGFPVDTDTALTLKSTSALEVTFLTTHQPARVVASTLPEARALSLAQLARPAPGSALTPLRLQTEDYVTTFRRVLTTENLPVWIVLQRSLAAELAPARDLETFLLFLTLGGLILAAITSLLLARSFSQPVQALAAHTRLIASGDYTTPIHLPRADELGDLALAFNTMSTGLAERDRVRDLLDKNVSPEVAARLLRDGAALGGEERLVTIVFADLRGFTPLSETLSPHDLLTLLNRYLDRMSAVIEAEGGVIDKYIGDEIMALFGAPEARPDDADRALRAALGMRRALAAFNQELATEGRPALGFGVGINTARVVAGNIGSHRRLNYSVLGDGVNIAARLQPLTRRADWAADIIVSDATRRAAQGDYTWRDLGPVTVKGKSGQLHVHALDA